VREDSVYDPLENDPRRETGSPSDSTDGQLAVSALSDGQVTLSALTPRQREVAALVARGLTNAEIAEHLVLTHGTVANHVAGILQRLNFDSRTQIAGWAVERGMHGSQDRLLTTLERLLEVHPSTLKAAMDHAADLVAEALHADKVDAFLYEASSTTLVAVGTSATELGKKQRALGLHRLQIANSGRVVQVYQTGEPFFDNDTQSDEQELIGIKRDLGIRSQIAVPLEIAGMRRGVLAAASSQRDFFAGRDMLFLQAVSRWVANAAHRAEMAEQTASAALEQGRRTAADELVAVLARDLHNLLVPIRRRLDLMQRRAARAEDTPNLHDTTELRKSVDRLTSLITDLLDVARIDQDLFALVREPVDLGVLIAEVIAAVSLPDRRIELELEPGGEVRVIADRPRLRQALESLLANAVHHARPGTCVGVRVAQRQSEAGVMVTVDVTDRGAGIDPLVLPRLFDRFVRSPDSTGLGIGLYMAHQIVEAHNGTLEVVSTSSMGTHFRLCIPAESVEGGGD
jgi:two-component system OmpR family sensor kinase